MRRVLSNLDQDDPQDREQFTPREQDILGRLLDGATNKEIAYQLGVGVSTVKSLLQTLFRKTGVRTRAQLVRIVLEDHREAISSNGESSTAAAGRTAS